MGALQIRSNYWAPDTELLQVRRCLLLIANPGVSSQIGAKELKELLAAEGHSGYKPPNNQCWAAPYWELRILSWLSIRSSLRVVTKPSQ